MRPVFLTLTLLAILILSAGCGAGAGDRPNILWITSEDNGPHLGAYGFHYADTPNLDALAAEGMIYTNAWSNAPVCSPARTTIITGVYATSLGAEHMRTFTRLPPEIRMSPQFLREAGYYCTNNVKEDYNVAKPGKVWDESSRQAHWRKRPDPAQPFYAVFNFTMTHESQIRKRPHRKVHDPATAPLPAYHPDAPEVREDWAQYHDKITEMDASAGEILRQLDQDGLADDTIVFYYSDHGPGLPRSKRWPYNSGNHVPLIVRIPEKYWQLAPEQWRVGGESDRMVGFIDMAPTLLSMAGIRPPAYMQGSAFAGNYVQPARDYNYGFTGRNGERYDFVRSVRDSRYVYLRNFHPHRVYGQHVNYLFQTPTTRAWKRLYDEGKLRPPQTLFWEPKPPEELYDLHADPDEVNNLAGSPEHRDVLERLRRELRNWMIEVRDVSFLPEYEIYTREAGMAPYEMARDEGRYPLERILSTAELASSLKDGVTGELVGALADDDSAVRYWGAMGLLMRGRDAVTEGRAALVRALADEAPSVRVAAGEALGRYGSASEASKALEVLLDCADAEKNDVYLSTMALNAIDYMDERARPQKDRIAALPEVDPKASNRVKDLIRHLKAKILSDLE